MISEGLCDYVHYVKILFCINETNYIKKDIS